MEHSKTLEETKLWQIYTKKTKDNARLGWTKEAYESACIQLKAVRDTFENYTLHDETHVLNVLDAMAGLLGNRIKDLTVGEVELLILSSAFHDLGMVYSTEERKACLSDTYKLRDYFSANPDMRGKDIEDWDEFEQQDYLRWLHPFRVQDVLLQPYWQNLFSNSPQEVVSEKVIIAVCRAHGESPEIIRREAIATKGLLRYIGNRKVDPLFCVILLRLADILDFDDSRAPAVLFSYSGKNKKSVEEWNKHKSSMGFNYPNTPDSKELPYGARFTAPTIERAANKFLDWIDEELSNSRSLLLLTNERWNHFVLPYQVDRSEIERVGYDFGDFKITMDQTRILELLAGENLYSDSSVFVRELLQNSIDATLTRAEMDSSFAEKINTDEARIDLWEWWDEKGDLWFRIDDFGTGMTRGMIEKYFLKAGNSYYNSQEFKRDLNGKSFKSISRFGIGFLSCFLCGVEAFVSTKYWNPEKNIREIERHADIRIEQNAFGLRLDVVGLNEYYTLKNQALIDNHPTPLPSPPNNYPRPDEGIEKDGYRVFPGTSIAIRIDSGKLGTKSLIESAKLWALYPLMPIYFNGKRLCMTQDELVALAKTEQGIKEYELSDIEKKELDSLLPDRVGDYPRIKETIECFDANQIVGLPRLKILLLETKVVFSDEDQNHDYPGYMYYDDSDFRDPRIRVHLAGKHNYDTELSFQSKDKRRLFEIISNSGNNYFACYGWKGIKACHNNSLFYAHGQSLLVLDEDEERPVLKANRDNSVIIPLKTCLTINAWLKMKHVDSFSFTDNPVNHSVEESLKEWRTIVSSAVGDWIDITSWSSYIDFKNTLEQDFSHFDRESDRLLIVDALPEGICISRTYIYKYIVAYLQSNYRIVVNYSQKKLKFCKLDSTENRGQFDLFPPMLFCYGDTKKDCVYLCCTSLGLRFVVTANHPFMIWLLDNSIRLHQHYPSQFNQIITSLRQSTVNDLIEEVNAIVEQLSISAYRYGIDASNCPKLTVNDFKDALF